MIIKRIPQQEEKKRDNFIVYDAREKFGTGSVESSYMSFTRKILVSARAIDFSEANETHNYH